VTWGFRGKLLPPDFAPAGAKSGSFALPKPLAAHGGKPYPIIRIQLAAVSVFAVFRVGKPEFVDERSVCMRIFGAE
jgi:hypothetical protein